MNKVSLNAHVAVLALWLPEMRSLPEILEEQRREIEGNLAKLCSLKFSSSFMLTPESGSREIHGELSTGTVKESLKPFPEVPISRALPARGLEPGTDLWCQLCPLPVLCNP